MHRFVEKAYSQSAFSDSQTWLDRPPTTIQKMGKMETTFLVCVAFSCMMAACITAYKQVPSINLRVKGQVPKYRWRKSTSMADFNDPLYPQQFHLNDKFGVTMNIRKAWSKGYTGKNVTICINDPSGIWRRHDDFSKRFNLAASYNFVKNIVDPSPVTQAGESFGLLAHGSMMGGLAAAEANNGKCIVGVAYDAFISGVTLEVSTTSNQTQIKWTADSLVYKNQINDIYSCSWGPLNMGETNVGYMAPKIKNAVKSGAQTGRGGKGNIYVFANGNGGHFWNGTCGYDEYVSSIYTISISVVSGKNRPSTQNVRCTGVSAVTYARDGNIGIHTLNDLMPSCANDNQCSNGKSGSSSSAAAIASGIFALLLQANPNLGWRDVQHLVARSSSSAFPTVTWKTNKAGIRVSDNFGFGLLDADALIENAKDWTNVGPQLECAVDFKVQERIHGVDTTIKSTDLTIWPSNCGGEPQRINFLEHVLLVVSFNYTMRKLVEIEIEAPTGTKSVILRSGRVFDIKDPDVKNLSILSLHHWGENPKGIWKMRLRNVKPDSKTSGYLFDWGLRFYGTKDDPLASNTIKPSQIGANFANSTTQPPVTPRNTASPSISSTRPTVSGFSTNLKATTNPINGTAGTRKVSTAAIKRNGSTSLISCKWMLLTCAILMSSLVWGDELLRNAEG